MKNEKIIASKIETILNGEKSNEYYLVHFQNMENHYQNVVDLKLTREEVELLLEQVTATLKV